MFIFWRETNESDENNDIYSKNVYKIALSNDDDKRSVMEDNIHTLALRELDINNRWLTAKRK